MTGTKRNNNNHPWKKAISWQTAIDQKINKEKIDKIEKREAENDRKRGIEITRKDYGNT